MAEQEKGFSSEVANSLGSLVQQVAFGFQNTPTISQTDTLRKNNRWYLLSNDRALLSELYVEHGLIQTLVDQPVDDALRAGFDIKTGQLEADQIEDLELYLDHCGIIEANTDAMKWGRLFGGGAVLLITEQKPDTPLDMEKLKEGQRIEFRGVDLWELYQLDQRPQGDTKLDENTDYYYYYGQRVHPSRVLPFRGKKAPSLIRPRLRGWGMSELEKIVRSFNQYLKNQDVVFELLDEAKVDVYKIKGFTSALLNKEGTQQISDRVQMANMLKNFLNALTMDSEDDYSQKQMNFSGLGEMLVQIRQGIAADLKMPLTKLFGISAAGFSSGEDDIENYNSMLESEIRFKCKKNIIASVQIACQIKFGFIPDDLKIVFRPLRILSAKEEEEVKNSKFNRTMKSYESGAISHETFVDAMNKDTLLPVEIPKTDSQSEPLAGQFTVTAGDNVS